MTIDGRDAYSAQHQWIGPLKPAQATGAAAADDSAASVAMATSEKMASKRIFPRRSTVLEAAVEL
jgi:hypothetical protein